MEKVKKTVYVLNVSITYVSTGGYFGQKESFYNKTDTFTNREAALSAKKFYEIEYIEPGIGAMPGTIKRSIQLKTLTFDIYTSSGRSW